VPVAQVVDIQSLGLDVDLCTESDIASAELVLSIGGDGTMLRSVTMLNGAAVPVLGINMGLLGYLAEVEPENLVSSLERFFAGDYEIEKRLVIDVDVVKNDGSTTQWRALNEASFEKERTGQTVRLAVSIDGARFTTFQADGLLVATPTGSTAYSLSARGPVVSPTLEAMLLTPLAPHMLFDRSLVLGPTETIRIDVDGSRSVGLAIDGQEVASLEGGESVTCSASDRPALFVRMQPQRFHQILKAKFGLADR
jgi:NAD+ kinase